MSNLQDISMSPDNLSFWQIGLESAETEEKQQNQNVSLYSKHFHSRLSCISIKTHRIHRGQLSGFNLKHTSGLTAAVAALLPITVCRTDAEFGG